MKKIGLISMVLVLAMGMMGVGSAWADTVVAGEMDTDFVGIRNVSTDDPIGSWDPVWTGTEIVTSEENVASCISTNGDPKCLNGETQFYDSVTETINNAYPGYAPTMTIEVANCGSTTVTVTGLEKAFIAGNEDLMEYFVWLHYWSLERSDGYFLDGTGEDWLYYYLTIYDDGYKLDPGDVVTLTLNLIILDVSSTGQEFPQGETVTLEDTFTYTDNDGNTDTTMVTITLNNLPVANSDSYSTNEDTPLTVTAPGVLGNDDDEDSDPLTAVKVTDPANGTLILNDDGSFTYNPAANFNGTDSFTYKANDGTADSNIATVSITVNAVNDPPTISDITDQSTNENTSTSAIAFTVEDLETPAGSLVVSGSSSNQLLVPDANIVFGGSGASRTLTITPAPNQNGTATITVTVNDGSLSSSDTFVLTVNAGNVGMGFSIDKMVIDFSRQDDRDSINMKASFALPDGVNFDPALDTVKFNIDGVSIDIPADSFKANKKESRFTYDSAKGVDPKVSVNLDFKKGEVTLVVKKASVDVIDNSDGVAVTFSIGSVDGVQTINMFISALTYPKQR